jgi:hypothetical protein
VTTSTTAITLAAESILIPSNTWLIAYVCGGG